MLTGKELPGIQYPQGEKTKSLIAACDRYVVRGLSRNGIYAEEARGAIIRDFDGNLYLDMYAGIGVLNVGHCPDPVVDAIRDQSGKLLHSFFSYMQYEPYIALCEKMAQLSPIKGDVRVGLYNSGAEAVENAVKVARAATKRPGIIAFTNAFHGRTMMAMSLTSKIHPYKYSFGPFAPEVYRAESAYCYRCPWNSAYPGCGMHCLEQFEWYFKGEVDPDNIAAMIVEPIQGEGGFITPPEEFLRGLQKLCNDNGILFITDEIQSGFCRTGTMFASEQFGIEPDIMPFAKSVAAGMPVSGVIGKAAFMDVPNPGQLGGTYSGNPVACAAANAAVDILVNDNLAKRAREIGEIMTTEYLLPLKERFPANVGDVRGLGAMLAVEFVKDAETKEPDAETVNKAIAYCRSKGVIIVSCGIYGNTIRFLTPLVITDEQLRFGLQCFADGVAAALP